MSARVARLLLTRPPLARLLLAGLATAIALGPPALAQAPAAPASAAQSPARAPIAPSDQVAIAVEGVSITVGDLDRSIDFFTRTLDFKLLERSERGGEAFERENGLFGATAEAALLALGAERIELMAFRSATGRPVAPDARSNDRTFQHIAIVVSDMTKAYERVRASGTRFASSMPQELPAWNPNAGGIRAFYFRDPDGHALELIWFPKGKGDPRWQESGDKLFLGIDHTAIVVGQSARSLGFYRDLLGLRVAGESENYGPEQEQLNGVFGAHLKITGLKAPGTGMGVEFLEYISPSNGREMPLDTTPADLWHWRTIVRVKGPIDDRRLHDEGARLVSGGRRTPDDARESVMVKDPDGHGVLLTTKARLQPEHD